MNTLRELHEICRTPTEPASSKESSTESIEHLIDPNDSSNIFSLFDNPKVSPVICDGNRVIQQPQKDLYLNEILLDNKEVKRRFSVFSSRTMISSNGFKKRIPLQGGVCAAKERENDICEDEEYDIIQTEHSTPEGTVYVQQPVKILSSRNCTTR